jgi:hypothetical protein
MRNYQNGYPSKLLGFKWKQNKIVKKRCSVLERLAHQRGIRKHHLSTTLLPDDGISRHFLFGFDTRNRQIDGLACPHRYIDVQRAYRPWRRGERNKLPLDRRRRWRWHGLRDDDRCNVQRLRHNRLSREVLPGSALDGVPTTVLGHWRRVVGCVFATGRWRSPRRPHRFASDGNLLWLDHVLCGNGAEEVGRAAAGGLRRFKTIAGSAWSWWRREDGHAVRGFGTGVNLQENVVLERVRKRIAIAGMC